MLRQMASVAILIVLSASAQAAEEQMVERVAKCRSITTAAERLACFDRAAESVDPSVARSESERAFADAEDTPEEFGTRGSAIAKKRAEEQKAQSPDVTAIEGVVTALTRAPHGEWVVTLNNGQVWRQKQAQTTFVLKVGEAVSIKRGALGSYRMTNSSGRGTAVNRVQ